jgi:hypothetical protein
MKWTFVDSCGLGVVPKPLAHGRVFHAFKKLQNGSYGLPHVSSSQSGYHPPGPSALSEPLKPTFFPAREHIPTGTAPHGAFLEPAMPGTAVFIISEDQ